MCSCVEGKEGLSSAAGVAGSITSTRHAMSRKRKPHQKSVIALQYRERGKKVRKTSKYVFKSFHRWWFIDEVLRVF